MKSMFHLIPLLSAAWFCFAAPGAFAQNAPPGPKAPAAPAPPKNSSPGKVAPNPAADTVAATAKIKMKLDSIVFPKVEFREVTLREAFDAIDRQAKQFDPAREGVHLSFELPKPPPPVYPPGVDPSTLPPPPPASETRLTLHLQNVPLIEVLRYVAALTDLEFKVEATGVHLRPSSDVMETREWKVPAKTFADKTQNNQGKPAAPGATPKLKPAKDFLTDRGITFAAGSQAIYDPSTSMLTVKNTLTQLDRVEQAFEAGADLRWKLESIVFPSVDFQGVTFREALEFVVKKSKELDPDREGVNIILKNPEAVSGAKDEAKITLQMRDARLYEVIRSVGGLANLQFKFEPTAVSLVPLAGKIQTRQWNVPSQVFQIGRGAKVKTPTEFFAERGIVFGPQTHAIYSPESSTLVVKHFPEPLEIVEQIIKAATDEMKPR